MLYLGIDLHRKQMTVSLRNEDGKPRRVVEVPVPLLYRPARRWYDARRKLSVGPSADQDARRAATVAVRSNLSAGGPVARPVSGSWFAESREPFVFGERAAGAVPLLPLRIARQCVGAVGGGAPFERVCSRGGLVPGVRLGDTMGNTLAVEGGTRDNSEVIASIVTSVTIPAGLAQSEVARGSLGSNPRGTWV